MEFVKGVVSCVVPCFNASNYLPACLESILNQTYPLGLIELCFTDDGSTDDTYTILINFKSKYEKLFYGICIEQHSENRGICAGINTMLPDVHGQYLTWFDSDDLLAKKCIELKVRFLQYHTDYQCVMGVGAVFEKNDINNISSYLGEKFIVTGNQFKNYLFTYNATSSGLNMVYSNALFHVLPEHRLREDVTEQNMYMMPLIASKYKIGHIPDIVYYYRLNPESDSHRIVRKTGQDFRKFYDDIDRLRYYAITDSLLPFEVKSYYYKIQSEISLVNRLNSLDMDLFYQDRNYVDFVVDFFLQNYDIKNLSAGKEIYVWGHSKRQLNLAKILNNYISIKGFIDSNSEDPDLNVICGGNINPEKMYVIITLERHEQIIHLLNQAGYFIGRDCCYPMELVYKMNRIVDR